MKSLNELLGQKKESNTEKAFRLASEAFEAMKAEAKNLPNKRLKFSIKVVDKK